MKANTVHAEWSDSPELILLGYHRKPSPRPVELSDVVDRLDYPFPSVIAAVFTLEVADPDPVPYLDFHNSTVFISGADAAAPIRLHPDSLHLRVPDPAGLLTVNIYL